VTVIVDADLGDRLSQDIVTKSRRYKRNLCWFLLQSEKKAVPPIGSAA